MADAFRNHEASLDSPANNAAEITPNDTTDLASTARALYIGGGGAVKVDTAGGDTAVVFAGMTAGQILPVRVSRVYDTDTTATDIVAIW